MAGIMFGVLAIMLLLNVPIAMSLGLAVLVALLFGAEGTSAVVVVQRMFTSLDNFTLMAVPFFILSGDLMVKGGISEKLIKFMKMLLGRIPAALSVITTVSSAFFGAISGSNPATVAAIGGIMIPEMEKSGYPSSKAGAIAAASGTLGVIIPPSISMVTYAVITGASIGTMFIAGIVPGLLLALSLIIVSFIKCPNYEKQEQEEFSFSKLGKAFIDAIWALLMPVIILGGIYGGVFTPTEAAAVSVVYAIIVSIFIYKQLTWKDLPEIFTKSAISSAVVLITLALSSPFSWVMTSEQVPIKVAETVLGAFSSKIIILLLINFVLLFLGCFLETQSIIMLMTPMLYPLALELGIDPIALGIIMVVNTSIGMITPPMGVNMFVASGIAKTSIGSIVKDIMPYLIVELVVMFAMTYINEIILFLPRLMGLL